MTGKLTCVLDIGKTLSKLSLWGENGDLIIKETRPNKVIDGFIDANGVKEWVFATLKKFTEFGDIGAIFPVGHGACAALVKNDELSMPVIDYEYTIPSDIYNEYLKLRGDFYETGSPQLPQGLNLGAQLYYITQQYPNEFRDSVIMTWPQYWAWVLSGVFSSEVTSLGCHTDIFNPSTLDYSNFAKSSGIAQQMAPIRKANDILGNIRPEIANECGLAADVAIYCGIHDSNAALIAARGFGEIADNEATILSTGTWFIAMRSPDSAFDIKTLPRNSDCLVNIDAFNNKIPSSRFMGGREIESNIKIDTRQVDIAPDQPKLLDAVKDILRDNVFALPTFAKGYGPFPELEGEWINEPDDWYHKRSAICLYAAMVANECLNLIGAKDNILVEGRFAKAQVFIRALAQLRKGDKIYAANETNDVSYGALRLINPNLISTESLHIVEPLAEDISNYEIKWREIIANKAKQKVAV